MFNAEHRYLYPLFGILLALDAWIVLVLYRHWAMVRKAALRYIAVLVVIGLGFVFLFVLACELLKHRRIGR